MTLPDPGNRAIREREACLLGSPVYSTRPVHPGHVRGCSSAGRALRSQCRGQGFDPPQLHFDNQQASVRRSLGGAGLIRACGAFAPAWTGAARGSGTSSVRPASRRCAARSSAQAPPAAAPRSGCRKAHVCGPCLGCGLLRASAWPASKPHPRCAAVICGSCSAEQGARDGQLVVEARSCGAELIGSLGGCARSRRTGPRRDDGGGMIPRGSDHEGPSDSCAGHATRGRVARLWLRRALQHGRRAQTAARSVMPRMQRAHPQPRAAAEDISLAAVSCG